MRSRLAWVVLVSAAVARAQTDGGSTPPAQSPAPAGGAPAVPAAPAPSDAPAEGAQPDKPGKPAAEPSGTDVLKPAPTTNVQRVRKKLDRLQELPPEEQQQVLDEMMRQVTPPKPDVPQVALPATTPDVGAGPGSELESARRVARHFFENIIAGDARALVSYSTFPFFLDGRTVAQPDELFQEWLKNLRAKRTDLLKLYDVEVLTPAEMEKKYGRPPSRLQAMPWQRSRTYVAVGNLSGRAAVAVIKDTGSGWRVVGYHD